MARTIEIGEQVTVGSLAQLLYIPVSQLIGELFKNGIAATVNEKIDFDTAQIVVGELGMDVELARKEIGAGMSERPKKALSARAMPRPPVVAMMGHVDHGKTSLLDAIRGTDDVKAEAGGITQHLSAYQIQHNKRLLTFLDTPGHEAFAALREHGARLTDLVVIVIAADDGIKPQTLEAIRFARKAGVKIIVAANKMDKATEANLNHLKQQLSENELLPEDWGGGTIVMPVSAKTKQGLNELLDMILLVADVEELKADIDGPAQGLIIESHMEKGRGAVAEALVEQGTLHQGDFIAAGVSYGKVRNLENPEHQSIKIAGPSTPVVVVGLKNLPEFGDEFIVVESEKLARDQATQTHQIRRSDRVGATTSSSELLRIINRTHQLSELNIVVKADVQGSLISVIDSLKSLDTEEVAVRVVGSGVGVISENDIHTATSAGAIIYGFNVGLPTSIKRLAARDHVSVRLYTIIYELLDDVKKDLETHLEPEIIEKKIGELNVKGVFKITRTEVICGGEVTSGKLSIPALAKLYRSKDLIAQDLEVTNLKRGPQDVKEVLENELCGLSLKTEKRLDIQENDRLEFYTKETKIRTL